MELCIEDILIFYKCDVKNNANVFISGKKSEYAWTQTMEEVKLWFRVPFNINKNEVDIEFKPDTLRVSYREQSVIEGALTKPISIEGSYWIIDTPK